MSAKINQDAVVTHVRPKSQAYLSDEADANTYFGRVRRLAEERAAAEVDQLERRAAQKTRTEPLISLLAALLVGVITVLAIADSQWQATGLGSIAFIGATWASWRAFVAAGALWNWRGRSHNRD
jgi:hypothetical protein